MRKKYSNFENCCFIMIGSWRFIDVVIVVVVAVTVVLPFIVGCFKLILAQIAVMIIPSISSFYLFLCLLLLFSLSVSLSLSLSLSLSIYLSIYLSISLSISLPLSLPLPICLSISLKLFQKQSNSTLPRRQLKKSFVIISLVKFHYFTLQNNGLHDTYHVFKRLLVFVLSYITKSILFLLRLTLLYKLVY